jgi:hypothetical protein
MKLTYERTLSIYAGVVFYNDEGSENGGLIFGGRKNAKGEVVDSGGALSFDRYDGNQEVQLIGVHDKEDRFAGLIVADSPPGGAVMGTAASGSGRKMMVRPELSCETRMVRSDWFSKCLLSERPASVFWMRRAR